MRSILTEIIRKECETYRLIDRGWLRSVEEGTGKVYTFASDLSTGGWADKEGFLTWRRKILLHFYQSIGFTGKWRHLKAEVVFQSFLFDLKKKVLRMYRERYNGKTIDDDLAVPPHTIAFKLSSQLAKEQYGEEEAVLGTMQMPAEIEQYYQQRCAVCFPLNLDAFLKRIKQEDAVFGNELIRLIRVIAGKMMSYISVSVQYKEEILQDTWSDTYLFMTEKIQHDMLPVTESSLHLRNYIWNVCKNKAFEARRTNQAFEISGWADDFWEQLRETLQQESSAGINLDDVDIANADEVNRALTIVLLDRVAPWYDQLTAGIEEKTTLLLAHYAGGKSYEEMACEAAGHWGVTEKTRRENNLRQTVSRTRRLLRERFLKLLENKQNRYCQ